ncbi:MULTISPECIES: hypothetical protein [unclassified Streptomyces]|uniref:hypothetical protein n=1 Tax=unclassified Streptomyces TaxID=2593676 RepID=UPI000AA20B9A|nr:MULTISPECIES: hypothetical protein [unclassified Streptomyces]MYQ88449.1 hypothetical protein [Streptomyces sp. SID4936]
MDLGASQTREQLTALLVNKATEAYAKAVDRHIAPPIELLMQLSRGPLSDEQHARYRSTAAGTSALVESRRQRFVPLARRALDGSMDVVD